MRTISRSCTRYCGNNSRSESTCGPNLYGVCSILRPTGEQREIQSRSTTRDFAQGSVFQRTYISFTGPYGVAKKPFI